MQTKTCPECQMDIPAKAKRCPYCREKLGMPLLVKIIFTVMGLVLLFSLIPNPGAHPPPTSADYEDYGVRAMVKEAVAGALKSPSTAQFQDINEFTVTKSGKNVWNVSGYVDAQNSYGATARNHFRVSVAKIGNDWKVLESSITP